MPAEAEPQRAGNIIHSLLSPQKIDADLPPCQKSRTLATGAGDERENDEGTEEGHDGGAEES